MAERLTRSRAQGGGPPVVGLDPAAALLRQLSDAKQGAVVVLQDSNDGPRKLPEATAKVLQASTQLMEMVREDLAQLDDPAAEGGGLPHTTTPRLPPAQAGRAVAFLVEACHVTMRAVLEAAEPEAAPDLNYRQPNAAGPEPSAALPAPQRLGAAATGPPRPAALPPAQLWRCGVNVAAALQDATRLLAAPMYYMSYAVTDPSCDGLLAIGELAAGVMRRAATSSAAATAASRGLASGPQGGQEPPSAAAPPPDVVMAEAGPRSEGGSGAGSMTAAVAGRGQASGCSGGQRAGGPSDVACLLAAHGYSLLLVACEQQPEGLLDALQDQPGAPQRLKLLASAALELAAARIAETSVCGGERPDGESGAEGGDAAAAAAASDLGGYPSASQLSQPLPSQSPPLARAAGALPGCSYQMRQLQLVAMRFSELLADDGGYKLMAKQALLPALAEALMAEPQRFVSWWGCGRDALLSGLSNPDLLTAPQLQPRPRPPPPGTAAAAGGPGPRPPAPTPPPLHSSSGLLQSPPECRSTHEAKLQAAAVGMLLKSPAARNHCLPLLMACVRLPGAGSGFAAFGDGFRSERFLSGGDGDEREELYVGGRGRGYKRRRVLNPEAHGVDADSVAAVTAAMAVALELAVLMCRIVANASLGVPQEGGAAAAQAADEGEDSFIGPPAAAAESKEKLAGVERTAGAGAEGEQLHTMPLAEALLQLAIQAAGGAPGAAGRAGAAGGFPGVKQEESEGGFAGGGFGGGGGGVVAPALLAAARERLGRMARNLALLLSLMQPVCPSGGQEVRDSIRQLGFPCMRWPRSNVRLPVLVVSEDCELLVGLLEDLQQTAGEPGRRDEVERRQRDSEAQREAVRAERQLKRREAAQKEADRRQRDKERRQRDRDRLKALKQDPEQQMAAAGGMPPAYGDAAAEGFGGAEEDDEMLGSGAGLGLVGTHPGLGGAWDAAGDGGGGGGGAGAHQPRVRLVLRRGNGGGAAPGEGPGGDGGGGGAGTVKRESAGGEEGGFSDGGMDEAEDGAQGFGAYGIGPGAPGRQDLNGAGPHPAAYAGAEGGGDGERGLLLGVQVPRQRRSNRPMRPRTPTPPPEVLAQRDRSRAGVAAGGRRTSGSGGAAAGTGGAQRNSARQRYGGGGGAASEVPGGEEDDDWIGPVPGGQGPAAAGGDFDQQPQQHAFLAGGGPLPHLHPYPHGPSHLMPHGVGPHGQDPPPQHQPPYHHHHHLAAGAAGDGEATGGPAAKRQRAGAVPEAAAGPGPGHAGAVLPAGAGATAEHPAQHPALPAHGYAHTQHPYSHPYAAPQHPYPHPQPFSQPHQHHPQQPQHQVGYPPPQYPPQPPPQYPPQHPQPLPGTGGAGYPLVTQPLYGDGTAPYGHAAQPHAGKSGPGFSANGRGYGWTPAAPGVMLDGDAAAPGPLDVAGAQGGVAGGARRSWQGEAGTGAGEGFGGFGMDAARLRDLLHQQVAASGTRPAPSQPPQPGPS